MPGQSDAGKNPINLHFGSAPGELLSVQLTYGLYCLPTAYLSGSPLSHLYFTPISHLSHL